MISPMWTNYMFVMWGCIRMKDDVSREQSGLNSPVVFFYWLFHGGSSVTVLLSSWINGFICVVFFITKTCLYNLTPSTPLLHSKTGVYRVCIIFLFLLRNVDYGYSLEPPREYPQSMFWAEIWRISEFFIWKFSVFGGEIFYIFF